MDLISDTVNSRNTVSSEYREGLPLSSRCLATGYLLVERVGSPGESTGVGKHTLMHRASTSMRRGYTTTSTGVPSPRLHACLFFYLSTYPAASVYPLVEKLACVLYI